MASNRIIPSEGFVFVVAPSAKGNEWIRLAPVDADGVHVDAAQGYIVPANKLDEVKALRASLKGMYDMLTEHIGKLEAAAAATPATPAQVAPDTRVDALAAKVDALTEAMTALAQIVAKSTGPAVLAAPAPAKAATNGAAKAPATPANPLADLPF